MIIVNFTHAPVSTASVAPYVPRNRLPLHSVPLQFSCQYLSIVLINSMAIVLLKV